MGIGFLSDLSTYGEKSRQCLQMLPFRNYYRCVSPKLLLHKTVAAIVDGVSAEKATDAAAREPAPPVRVQSGALFESLAAVLAILHKGYHAYYDLGHAWFAKIAAEQPAATEQLHAFAGGSGRVWEHLIGLAAELDKQDLGAFADHLERMDAESLRLDLIGRRYRPIQRAVGIERIEAAAAGDPKAERDFLRLAWPEDAAWQTGLRKLLKRSAADTQRDLVGLLRILGRDVTPYVAPWLPALEADASEKRDAAGRLPPLDLVREAIDTAYAPTGDVSAITLIPSYVIRPFVDYFEHANQMVFLYPVGARFLGILGTEPPDRLVRLAAALGDHGRLRILAALKDREMSIKELGAALGLPRSTLRHHVGILRGAGLIRLMQTGSGFSSYQLREEAATDLAELVDAFLRAPTAPEPRKTR